MQNETNVLSLFTSASFLKSSLNLKAHPSVPLGYLNNKSRALANREWFEYMLAGPSGEYRVVLGEDIQKFNQTVGLK